MRNSFSQQLGLGNIQIPIMTQIFVASTCDQLVKFATKHMFLCSRLKQLLAYISLSPLVRPISPPKNGMWGLPCHSAFLNNKLGHRWPPRPTPSEFLPQSALSLCAVVVGRGRNTNRQAHKHKYTNTNTNTQSALSLCAVAAGGRNTNRQQTF